MNIKKIDKKELLRDLKRTCFIIIASVIMASNIKSFVRTGDLVPGGFNGLTLLLQRIFNQFLGISLPFTLISILLNAIPAIMSFKFIGKKFTLYSCLMIGLTSVFTDIIPANPVTYDVLLICIFGGLINGLAISICLHSDATSGGTDFIAVFVAEKLNKDAWNYILFGNAVIILISGYLFGWDKALYSIIFQFASTQVVQLLHQRYKKNTFLIITDEPEDVYNAIVSVTHHGATIFRGTGCYEHEVRNMVYSVVSSDEVKRVLNNIRKTDPKAFINVMKTDQLDGKFYQRPND